MSEEKKDGQEPKKVVVQSPAGSAIKPSAMTQITPAVKDPSKPDEAPPAATLAEDARRTIKLKPMQKGDAPSEEETVSVERSAVDTGADAAAKPSADKEDESETVKIEKPAKTAAAVKPVVPGAKQTIKLRPSAGTAAAPQAEEAEGSHAGASTIKVKPTGAEEEAAGVQQTKKTIRLVAKKPAEAAAKPSDPTAKLGGGEEDTAALARPSMPTTKLPAESAEDEDVYATTPGAAPSGPAASKKTLKLRTTKLKAPASGAADSSAAKADDLSETDAGLAEASGQLEAPRMAAAGEADEGHIIFTIAAIVALLLCAYFAWMSAGQFGEQYLEWQSGNVPGLSK